MLIDGVEHLQRLGQGGRDEVLPEKPQAAVTIAGHQVYDGLAFFSVQAALWMVRRHGRKIAQALVCVEPAGADK